MGPSLLLGDGERLTLQQSSVLPSRFSGVDLLALSACDTTTGSMGDGWEVEGFAGLDQRKGAIEVVATLWPVADESTRLLMREFYSCTQSQPGMTKAAALQSAQLRLLRGMGIAADLKSMSGHRLQHPFYCAPFVRIGNWSSTEGPYTERAAVF